MLGWIPVLGPVVEGIVSIFQKKMDTDVQKLTTNRTNDVEEAKVSASIIQMTNDSISLRIMRDAACFFPVLWSALIGWDTIVAIRFPDLMFHVADYPPNVAYLPYAALIFLLGNIGINTWKRK